MKTSLLEIARKEIIQLGFKKKIPGLLYYRASKVMIPRDSHTCCPERRTYRMDLEKFKNWAIVCTVHCALIICACWGMAAVQFCLLMKLLYRLAHTVSIFAPLTVVRISFHLRTFSPPVQPVHCFTSKHRHVTNFARFKFTLSSTSCAWWKHEMKMIKSAHGADFYRSARVCKPLRNCLTAGWGGDL